ncbi:hypothetical protein BROUX41_005216 [Berkeleyomyces rouxiae]|uniref:uncharacterized protein n=1 Tax=Berkeleyomyces rouxiae TaxID=2035830 RepID=UPI003B76ADE4
MTDQYLQEQHAFMSRAPREPSSSPSQSSDINHKHSWVMLSQDKDIIRLPHEHIRLVTGHRISLELGAAKAFQSESQPPFSIKSDDGTAYITTQRLIYIPARPTEAFQSFTAPILNLEDSHISSPWFGSWYWTASMTPVSQGGIPPEIPRVEVKLTFKDGGHNEFMARFVEIKERLYHIRDIEQETGQAIGSIPEEQLPAYSPQTLGVPRGAGNTAPYGHSRSGSTASQNRSPNEPPPGYEEAQAQQVSMRLEDHIRHNAERE